MSTLFVVDDDMIYQRIIKITLTKYPAFKYVHYFSSAESIIRYLKENKDDASNLPDVIFLDIHMPETDGWAVLDELRYMYSSLAKNIGVYIVSVSVLEKDMQRARRYHFVKEFISKPLGKDTIIAIGEEFMHGVPVLK